MKQLKQIFEQGEIALQKNSLNKYLADTGIDFEEKLHAILPLSYFIMSFMDLMQVIYDETDDSELQKILNVHSQEDSGHWIWYLNDIERLNINGVLSKNIKDVIAQIWDKDYLAIRKLTYTVFRYFYQYPKKGFTLLIIEVLEAGYAAFSEALEPAVKEMNLYNTLKFFGKTHADAEREHEVHQIDRYELWHKMTSNFDAQEMKKAESMVNDLFDKLNAMHISLVGNYI